MPHSTTKLWTRSTASRKGYFIQTPTQIRLFMWAGNDNWWETIISYHDTITTPLGDGGDGYRGWRTEIWWLCTRSGNTFTRRVPVTAQNTSYATSEFDIAIQEVAAADFTGGRVHGKHADTGTTTFAIDGSSVSTNRTAEGEFTTFVLTEASSLKRDADGVTELATLTKIMTFTAFKSLYELTGTLTWKFGANINNCYIGMVPVARNETLGGYGQITTTSTQWSSGTTIDVTNSGFVETINTDADVRITSPTSGVVVHGRATAGWNSALRRFRVSNNAGSNKLYWKFVDGTVVSDTSIAFGMEFRVRDNR